MENPDLKEERHKFYEDVIAKLGEPATETDFPAKYLTPIYDAYVKYMTEGKPNAPGKDLEPTPEASDNYVNIDVMFPHGSNLSMVWFIECKFDAYGKLIGRSNDNPILESLHYLV